MSVEVLPDAPLAVAGTTHGRLPVTATATPNRRMAGVEWFRAAACFGVILFHTGAPGGAAGYGGMLGLTAVSAAFTVTNYFRTPRVMVWKPVQRMLLPWLFWCAVYTLVNVSKIVLRHGVLVWPDCLGWDSPLIGAAGHLWFLPFIFVVSITLMWLLAERGKVSDLGLGWGGLAAFLALIVPCVMIAQYKWVPAPFTQWLVCLPAVAWGLVLAAQARGQAGHRWWFMAQTAIALTAAVVAWPFLGAKFSLPYTAALVACVVAWSIKTPVGFWGRKAGELSYGIYLVHPLILMVLYRRFDVQSHPMPVAILAFLGAAVLTAIIRMTPLRRFV